ncbi:glycosyltransferase family 4 protein [Aeromonas veronii]|uniref:glycosyltransferase family 4 protein n=1 Tax=Aeromonas veronii TaxID=654 RepID=UPI001F486242|nr:glycosyltransferase family 4 protein [Aeromonas veronii]MCF5718734.1 glycosyltransferase family 4 protein [Aeromonas veronii]
MKKNILLLSNAYYPSIGGIENSLRHLAQEAQKNGDIPKIIVSDIGVHKNENRFYAVVEGVDVKRYPLSPKSNWMKIFNPFFSIYEHYKILKNEKLKSNDENTIVIARFHYSAYLAHLAGFKNVRYVVPSVYKNQLKVEPNTSIFQKIKQKARLLIHNFIQKKSLLHSENYVFSKTMERQCIELAGDASKPYIITKPGVDESRFYPVSYEKKKSLRQKLGLPVDKPIVLFVGRFVAAKGVSILLDAFAKLNTDATLVLVGEGTEHQVYINKISLLGLNDRVMIFPPTREVEQFYQSADLFAMTSNYEPLGQTILEAMAAGLKIIAFRPSVIIDTAIEELKINNVVSYVEHYSPFDLASVLENCVSTETLIHSQQSTKELNVPSYTWKSLYKELVKDGYK